LWLLFIGCAPPPYTITETEKAAQTLIHPQAFDIEKSRADFNFFHTNYKVKLAYPSSDIYNYYHDELTKLGFLVFKDGLLQMEGPTKWSMFLESSSEALVHQQMGAWRDKEGKRYFHLVQRYYSSYGSREEMFEAEIPNNSNLHVYFQIMDYEQMQKETKIIKLIDSLPSIIQRWVLESVAAVYGSNEG